MDSKELQEFKKTLTDKVKEIETLKKSLVEQIKPDIQKLFIETLKKYPQLTFQWTQYVPAFNDGEPCEFTVGEFGASVKDIEMDYDNEPTLPVCSVYFETTKYQNEETFKELVALFGSIEALKEVSDEVDTLRDVFNKIPEDVLETIFGSNVKVLIDINGFSIEED